MHVPAIRDGDIPFGKGRAVQAFATFLIGKLNEAEPFARQVEGAMKPPQFIVFLGVFPSFRNSGSIEQPDAPPTAAGFGPSLSSMPTRCSIQAPHLRKRLSKATLKRSAARGRGPRACQSQPHPAKAISQDETQQVRRTAHRPRPPEGPKLARRGFEGSLYRQVAPAMPAKVRSEAFRGSCHAKI